MSCEHDREWFRKLSVSVPENVEYINMPIGNGYVDAIKRYPERFHVVVLDGRERVKCAANAIECLRPDGIVVWDNAERERYVPGFEMLTAAGFRRLDFVGMLALTATRQCTSVFYRDRNCLGI